MTSPRQFNVAEDVWSRGDEPLVVPNGNGIIPFGLCHPFIERPVQRDRTIMSSPSLADRISRNLELVRERIRKAAIRGGRSEQDVLLVAVTKYSTWDAVLALLEQGHQILGENRPQQLTERAARLARERPDLTAQWHLIGQLQRNKVRSLLSDSRMIHSVDSLRLLERISQVASESGELRPSILLQVNVSGEESKSGFSREELRSLFGTIAEQAHVSIDGLMTMAPLTEDQSVIRHVFRSLRELRDEVATPTMPLPHLSMGMSGDYEIAIEEGATLVRIGSALFDGCDS